MRLICDLCGDPMPEAASIEVSGWQQPRTDGGLNHVLARSETGRKACDSCTRKMRDGVQIAQQVLL